MRIVPAYWLINSSITVMMILMTIISMMTSSAFAKSASGNDDHSMELALFVLMLTINKFLLRHSPTVCYAIAAVQLSIGFIPLAAHWMERTVGRESLEGQSVVCGEKLPKIFLLVCHHHHIQNCVHALCKIVPVCNICPAVPYSMQWLLWPPPQKNNTKDFRLIYTSGNPSAR